MNDIEQSCKFQFDEKMGYIGPIPFELNTTVLSVEIKLPKLIAEEQNPDDLINKDKKLNIKNLTTSVEKKTEQYDLVNKIKIGRSEQTQIQDMIDYMHEIFMLEDRYKQYAEIRTLD